MNTHPLFKSFWMAGFEGADHVNSHGRVLSMNRANAHWDLIEDDYRRLADFGISTVRESVGWRAFEEDKDYLQRLASHAEIARRQDMQVIWTLHHYGLPRDVDFFAPDFPARFADFCDRVARCLLPLTDGPPIFQPINEISYLSWAASAGQLIPLPHSRPTLGHELKRQLVRATIAGCDALWAVAPGARIVHTDPMIHVTGPKQGTEAQHLEARMLSEAQFEAWDMIAGKTEPWLGGAMRYLDVIGVNYYHPNQWEHPSNERLHWHLGDPRRRDAADMLAEVRRRYGRPVFIAETGHFGHGRADWLDDIASAARRCELRGTPIEGICLYPIVDRHDWLDPAHWHRSGLWDLPEPLHRPEHRVLNRALADRLRYWQKLLPASKVRITEIA
jgi:UDP-galactopyranose mutase